MHPYQHVAVVEQRQRARRDAAHRHRALRAVRAALRAGSGDPTVLMNSKTYDMMERRYRSPTTRRARLRLSLGFHLVELGLRLATPDARTSRAASPVTAVRDGRG